MTEGKIVKWLKKEGESISSGEAICRGRDRQVDLEVEAFDDGVAARRLLDPPRARPGRSARPSRCIRRRDSARTFDGLGRSARKAAAPASARAARPRHGPAARRPARSRVVPTQVPRRAARCGRELRAPAAARRRRPRRPAALRREPHPRHAARAAHRGERSVDLREIEGSGPFGAIVVADIETYLKQVEDHAEDAEGVRATPLALRVADELGLSLEGVKGSGPGGRVTKTDVLYFQKREAERAEEREAELFRSTIQLSQKRKALIRNMVRSKERAPHFYIQMDVLTDAFTALRDQLNRAGRQGPAAAHLHASHREGGGARARGLPRGQRHLPRGRGRRGGVRADQHRPRGGRERRARRADHQALPGQEPSASSREEANALIQRARMRKLTVQDYADGTFTISNLGMIGVDRFYGIITPPQSSILSVSTMQPRPIVRDNAAARSAASPRSASPWITACSTA